MSFSTDQAPHPPKWLRGGNRETLYAKYLQRPAPAYRRQGVASLLLGHLFKQADAKNICRIFLEVRHSNRAAIALYRQHGFIPCGSRPGYYPCPDGSREDALLMEKPC